MKNMRGEVLEAIKEEARHTHLVPHGLCAPDALKLLDDMSRKQPELPVSQWYRGASGSQIRQLQREWNAWRKNGQAQAVETLQVKGAGKFGLDWFRMNHCLLRAAQEYGFDSTQHKALLTHLAYRACEVFALPEVLQELPPESDSERPLESTQSYDDDYPTQRQERRE